MTIAAATLPASAPKIQQTKLLIDGQWVDSVSGKTFATIDPATEQKITDIADGQPEDIDLAVKAARKAFDKGSWRKMDARDRGTLILKLADLMDRDVVDARRQLELG